SQRIADDSVFYSILSITGSQCGSLNSGKLRAGDIRRRILTVHVLDHVHGGGQQVSPEIRRGASENSVEIFRKALRFHQRFAPAVVTAIERGVARRIVVEGLYEGFGVFRRGVQAAIAEINDLLWMLVRPACVFGIALMPGVGRGSGVASPQIVGESEVVDGTGESAIADAQEFAIPVRSRQPHFEANIGIGAWPDYSGQTAKRGKFVEGPAGRWCESARGHGLSRSDGSVRQFYAAETCVISGVADKGRCRQEKGQRHEGARWKHSHIVGS